MRNMEHWRAVGAFMLWTLLVQIGCTAWVLLFEGGKLSRICVHSLVLAANNTGILAPVVLEAAVGPSAAAVGMLATIVLYFQQLPVAMVLFELDRITTRKERPEEEEQQENDDRDGGVGVDGVVEDGGGSMAVEVGDGGGRLLVSCGGGGGGSGAVVQWPGRAGGSGGGGGGSGGAGRDGSGSGGDAEGPKSGLWEAVAPSSRLRDGSPGRVAALAAAAGAASGEASPTKGLGIVNAKLMSGQRSGGGGGGEPRAAAWLGRSVSQRGWRAGTSTSSPSAAASSSPPPLPGTTTDAGGSGGGGEGSGGGPGTRPGRRWAAKTASCVWTAVGEEGGSGGKAKGSSGGGGGGEGGVRLPAAAATVGVDADEGNDAVGGAAAARVRDAACATGAATPWTPWASASAAGGVGGGGGHGAWTAATPSSEVVDAEHLTQQHLYKPHHASEALRYRYHQLPLRLTAAATPDEAEPSLRHAAQLVLGNALMWTTGAATAVSMLGLHSLLDPEVPTHLPALRFIEGTLAWLARCSVPVSLFAMGLFIASRRGGCGGGAAAARVVTYLAIKLFALPGLMVFVNSLLGLDGRLATSLVVLTCVPVGQNAFLVTEQYGEGAEEVTGVMQAGLLLMLPHVAGVMAALRWLGMYQGSVA